MGIFLRGTPRNFKVRKKTSAPLLPEAAERFIADRFTDTIGAILTIAGVALAFSLLSYNSHDPSVNNAVVITETHNLLGVSGAYVSDVLLQTLGLAAYLFSIAFIVWGARIFTRRPVGHYAQRLMLLLASALACSVMLARVPSFESWGLGAYLGGSAGALIYASATVYLQDWLGKFAFVFLATLSCGVFAGCYMLALGVSVGEWISGFGSMREIAANTRAFVSEVSARISEWHSDRTAQKTPALARKSRVHLREDTAIEETVEEESPLPASLRQKPIVVPRAEKLKPAPAKKEERQKKLDLWSSDEEWRLPSLDLLQARATTSSFKLDEASLQKNAEMLQSTLRDFGVEGDILKVSPGPIVTLYEMEPAPGTKTSRVIGLSDDIARSMSAISVRIAVVPGKNVIGIELPNAKRETVFLKEMLSSSDYEKAPVRLPLALGKNIAGDAVIADLARMPHLLVAGTTGSGKSVAINTMILSLLYRLSPEQCRLIMIDPKMLELSVYDDIPHLLTPVVTEPRRAITALKWAVREMEDRYRSMSKLGVRNIDGFNERIRDARTRGEVLTHKVQTGFDPDTGRPLYEDQPLPQVELPYIVIIVDEFADLMLVAGKEVENSIQRLAQMARAAGIHLIMATQRPSVDVITGVIKANFPTRISFQVTSKIDSRTILGEGGAEQLLGQGDMLYMATGGRLMRVHGPFVTDEEVEKIVKFLRAQGEPVYIDAVTVDTEEDESGDVTGSSGGVVDELYDQAVNLVLSERKASTSFIQRHFQIGYNRAARIIERMEKEGVISAASHVGKREVLAGEHYGT